MNGKRMCQSYEIIDSPAFKGTHQLAVARVGGIGHDHVITGIHGQG